MIEGVEKRIVLYGSSVVSLYLAYLLKIRNPEVYISIIDSNSFTNSFFLSSSVSLNKTALFSLVDYKAITTNKYKTLKIINKNQKELLININNINLFDYEKLKKYLIASCISKNVDIISDCDLVKIDNKKIILKNRIDNAEKELTYFFLIFSEDLEEDIFSNKINIKKINYLSLTVDIKNKSQNVILNILDSSNKTSILEQPINEFTKKIIVSSKQKDLENIFTEFYKNKEYKILSKSSFIKKIVNQPPEKQDILFLGSCAGIYNHIIPDDIYLSLLNAETLEKLITEKIKLKKDIKEYNKKIFYLSKESETSKKIMDFLFSKTSAELDSLFTKINKLKILYKINLSSPRKEIQKLKLNPKSILLLKDILFK